MANQDRDLFNHLRELTEGRWGQMDWEDAPSPAAETIIGRILLNGYGSISADPKSALDWLISAAEKNVAEAKYILGTEYDRFKELNADFALSFSDRTRLLKEAARAGYGPAADYLEQQDQMHGDFDPWEMEDEQNKDALRRYLVTAEKGDPVAQFRCGDAYLELSHASAFSRKLLNVKPDALSTEKGEWLTYWRNAQMMIRRAAEHLPAARFYMANYFSSNEQEELDWLQRAAFPENGKSPSADALKELSARHRLGRGLPRDLGKGLHYLELAAATNQSDSRQQLGTALLTGAYGVKDEARGVNLLLSVKYPSLRTRFWIGLAYLRGIGVPRDLELAKKYFQDASEYGDPWGSVAVHLGWRKATRLHEAEAALFRWLEEQSFRPEEACPLTSDDVDSLLAINEDLKEHVAHMKELESSLLNPELAESPAASIIEDVRRRLQEKQMRTKGAIYFPLGTIRGLMHICSSRDLGGSELLGAIKRMWTFPSPIAQYILGALWEYGAFGYESHEKAVEHYKEAIEIVETQRDTGESYFVNQADFLLSLERKARDRIAENTRRLARADARQEILSFLSHTLTNAVAGTSETLRLLVRRITKHGLEGDEMRRGMVERLSRLATNMAVTETLVESFKLYASDPEALRTSWQQDRQGDVPVRRVVALATRQSLSRLLITAEHAQDFRRFAPESDIKAISQYFVDHILDLDMESDADISRLYAWIESQLPWLRFSLILGDDAKVSQHGTRFIVIFAVVSEMLSNAFKYGAGGKPILVKCVQDAGVLQLRCTNGITPEASKAVRGGRKGITFMRELCRLVGASFEEPNSESGMHQVGVTILLS